MKEYYSKRTWTNNNIEINLTILRRSLLSIYRELERAGYFQEAFWVDCSDGSTNWYLWTDIELKILLAIRKEGLWPIYLCVDNYKEDDIFDMIEFLFDHISFPEEKDAYYHSWNDCGWHYSVFNKTKWQEIFSEKLNLVLSGYKSWFKLDKEGYIVSKEGEWLEDIFDSKLPSCDIEIESKVSLAIHKYRHSRTNLDERRIAIRELADVCEKLRDDMKELLDSNDESDLFNIANKFWIRHANQQQKVNYDKDIWYSWMFYFYLSTIHVTLRIIDRSKKSQK